MSSELDNLTCESKLNSQKSAIDRPWKRKFLGFSFTSGKEPKISISNESKKRIKQRIRELTARSKIYINGTKNRKTEPISNWVV